VFLVLLISSYNFTHGQVIWVYLVISMVVWDLGQFSIQGWENEGIVYAALMTGILKVLTRVLISRIGLSLSNTKQFDNNLCHW